MIHAPLINSRRRPKRRPKHARPSVLAPTKALAILGGFGVLAVAAVAGCAAAAQHGSGHDAGAARPAVRVAAGAAHANANQDAGAFVRDAAGLAQAADSATPAPADLVGPGPGDGGNAATIDDAAAPDAAPVSGLAESGIPSTALSAYKNAAARETARKPECGITWPLLAGIGRVESNHGRFAGAELHADGVSTPRIIGIPLNGNGTALIRDTDGGQLDGDTVYDRAVGPMQFIPSTWGSWGVDANGDGLKDPFNLFDAAAAAADYLCAAGRDLRTSSGQVHAILSYNYSYDYVSMVMSLERVYAGQTGVSVPVLPVGPAEPPQHGRPRHKPPLPPVDPGRPGGVSHPTNPRVPIKHAPTTPAAPPSSSSHKPTPTPTPTSTSPSPTGSTSAPPTCPDPTPTDTASSSASGDETSSAAPDPCATSTSAEPSPSGSDSTSP